MSGAALVFLVRFSCLMLAGLLWVMPWGWVLDCLALTIIFLVFWGAGCEWLRGRRRRGVVEEFLRGMTESERDRRRGK